MKVVMPLESPRRVKYHARELTKADKWAGSSYKAAQAAEKALHKSEAPIDKLMAQFEHTTNQMKANKAHKSHDRAKYKMNYHKAVLKWLGAVPKPTEKSIKATTKAKMNEKYNKKTSKLRNKLKSHASAAAILARQNRALVKKIDKHTGASARKRAAAAALKKKNAMKAKLAKAKKAVKSAQNP